MKKYWQQDDGLAALEAALTFPIFIAMLFAVVDIGSGITVNKKVVSASQITADLLSRAPAVTDADIQDAIAAARLAIEPYSTTDFGIDIAAVRFEGSSANPTIIWRETEGMTPNADVETRSDGLGTENEGLIFVTVEYNYSPRFSSVFLGDFNMREYAVFRGRRNSFVMRQE